MRHVCQAAPAAAIVVFRFVPASAVIRRNCIGIFLFINFAIIRNNRGAVMHLPFTVDQFYGVFSLYNTSVWPVQYILVALALAVLVMVLIPRRWSGSVITVTLGFLWAWMGVGYHLAFFAAINKASYVFAAAFLIEALLFMWYAFGKTRLSFSITSNLRTWIGMLLILFALVIYPLISHLAGHDYPTIPTFGLPCPTTIFTIGILAFANTALPRALLIIPALWCIVGSQAAFFLGVPQDLGLIATGLIALVFMIRPRIGLAGRA
jgi:hypothetical protein